MHCIKLTHYKAYALSLWGERNTFVTFGGQCNGICSVINKTRIMEYISVLSEYTFPFPLYMIALLLCRSCCSVAVGTSVGTIGSFNENSLRLLAVDLPQPLITRHIFCLGDIIVVFTVSNHTYAL